MSQSVSAAETREIVATFADRVGFESAVDALLAAGFTRTDLSVLGTHDSLEVAGPIAGYAPDPAGSVAAGLAGEGGFVATLGIAGLLLLAAGPVGAAAAALMAASAGVVALQPFFYQLTESSHAEGFAEAVAAGKILLWVRTEDAGKVERATAILHGSGGLGITPLARPLRETPE